MKVLEKNPLQVKSETATLKKVLIHRPDEGIEKVTPARATDLLYEDIVYLPRMREEHDTFTAALRLLIGEENVFDIENLLTEVLRNAEVRNTIIHTLCGVERPPQRLQDFLHDLEPEVLSHTLVTGIANYKKKISVFEPLPNFIFTRDLGTMVNDHLVISQASKEARTRESLICYYVFHHHPLFHEQREQGKIITMFDEEEGVCKDSQGNFRSCSLEGGDVMLVAKDHLLISTSERTTFNAFDRVREFLFNKGVVNKISLVELPKSRYCMHLDTIFTMITENEGVGFEPLVVKKNAMKIVQYARGEKSPRIFASLEELLVHENPMTEIIPCGMGMFPYDEREQWTDACNLVAVRDGVAFTYDRNIKTNQALREHGFEVIRAEDLIEGRYLPNQLHRTIITIPSSELSRARGGPHCMTMPLARG